MIFFLLCRLQRARYRQRDALPNFGFGFELALSGFGQTVILGPAIVLGFPARGSEPPRILHTVEGWEKRTGFDLKTPWVICAMRFETPSPCKGPKASALRTSMSSGPFKRYVLFSVIFAFL
jgi:hypothetical protein